MKIKNFYKKIALIFFVVMLVSPHGLLTTPVYAAATNTDSTGNTASTASCAPWSGVFFSCSIAYLMTNIMSWAADILTLAGTTFDYVIDYSLNMADRLNEFTFVTNGWAILRDVTNLGYIFILLFISLNIILGNATYGNKSLIAQVLITAVIVNFSLFGTKVIIDSTNIAALQFYNLIQPASTSSNTTAGKSITGQFMNVFGLQTFYSSSGIFGSQNSNGLLDSVGSSAITINNTDGNGFGQDETWWKIAKIAFFGTIFMLLVAVVFFAGAFLFIARTLTLFFLMMFSSMAVASRALPNTKGQFDKWLQKLISNAVFAPVFLALIYLFVAATLKTTGSINFTQILLSSGGAGQVITFFMYLGAFVAILGIAKTFGIYGGGAIAGFADKWISPKSVASRMTGGAKSIGKGVAVRTLGRGATGLAESGFARGLSRYVPGLAGGLSKVSGATGVDKLRSDAKKKQEFISGVSPRGVNETKEEYVKRTKAATDRGLKNLGLNPDGTDRTGLIATPANFLKEVFGGRIYAGQKEAARKKVKKEATDKLIAAADLAGSAEYVYNVTGIETFKRNSDGTINKDDIDEDAMLALYDAFNRKNWNFNSSTGELKIAGELIPKTEKIYKIIEAAETSKIPDVKKENNLELERIQKRLKTFKDTKSRISQKEDGESTKKDEPKK